MWENEKNVLLPATFKNHVLCEFRRNFRWDVLKVNEQKLSRISLSISLNKRLKIVIMKCQKKNHKFPRSFLKSHTKIMKNDRHILTKNQSVLNWNFNFYTLEWFIQFFRCANSTIMEEWKTRSQSELKWVFRVD